MENKKTEISVYTVDARASGKGTNHEKDSTFLSPVVSLICFYIGLPVNLVKQVSVITAIIVSCA